MTAKIYASLFRRRDKLMLLGFFVFFLFVAIALTRPNRAENDFLLLLCPALALGSVLIEIWHRPLRLPATVLLPGLQRTLFHRHIWLILAAAFIWGSICHWRDHRVPWIAALGLSGGLSTLPLCFIRGTSDRGDTIWLRGLLWGIIIGVNVPVITRLRSLTDPILSHIGIAGAAGWTLLAFNLRFAGRHRSPAVLVQSLLARNQASGLSRFRIAWRRGISGGVELDVSRPTRKYAPRQNSLFRQLQATFEETPMGFWMNVTSGSVVILIHPWVAQKFAGYPLAWYRVIFDPGRLAEGRASIFALIIVVLVASGLRPGLLRTGRLYPLSRRQRLTVAFTASAVGFCCNFLTIVGGSVLAGWLVGRWAGLPLPAQPAVTFITKMAMVVPFMPLMRWGGLHLELRQNMVELFLFIAVVAGLVIMGQSFVFNWGLQAGIGIALGSIVVSQLVYYAALRRFYCHGDLVQRRAICPVR